MRSTSEFEGDDDVGGVTIRPLAFDDGAMVKALVERQFAGTRYLARLLEQVALAIDPKDADYRGVVAMDAADAHSALGVLLLGEVAGAIGVVKVHALVGEHEEALRFLVASVEETIGAARIAICEIADSPPFAAAAHVLFASGFAEEARADSLMEAGVALRFLTRRVAAHL